MILLIKNNPDIPVEGIDFIVRVPEDFLIRGSREQIVQMLLNLSINAVQAMDYKGKLTFETNSEDNKNIIIVKDTGKGMSSDVQKNLFEPFYTTRKGGTGLGLAIVLRIVENHNGDISFYSEVGKGTTFIIKLPKQLQENLIRQNYGN